MIIKAKLIAAVCAVALSLISIAGYAAYLYGYSSAISDVHAETNMKIAERVDEALRQAESDHSFELDRVRADYKSMVESAQAKERIVVKTEEIIKYVNREIRVPAECTAFGDDINRVLIDANLSIGAGHKGGHTPVSYRF